MPDVGATEAARHFAALLDGIEHRGERYTIVRHGRPVARLEPVRRGSGAEVSLLMPAPAGPGLGARPRRFSIAARA